MPKAQVNFDKPSVEILSAGKIVGLTDHVYTIDGPTVVFDDVLVKGDLSGALDYNGREIQVVRVDTVIGLDISSYGVRGPVWKGVECKVIK